MGRRNSTASTAQRLLSLEGVFKFRYCGIGFIWAWIYGAFETFAVYPERAGIGINADPSWVVSAAAVTVSLLACGVFLRNRSTAPRHFPSVAAACTFLGTLLSALPLDGAPWPLVLASGLLTGFGTGALTVLWGMALIRLDVDQIEVAVPASSLVMFACALVLPYLTGWVGVVAIASLPVISLIMLRATEQSVGHGAMDPSDGQTPAARPAFTGALGRMGIIIFICYFVSGCTSAAATGSDTVFLLLGLDAPTLIGSCVGIVLMVCFILYSVRVDFDMLYRWIFPLLVGALVFSSGQDLGSAFLAGTLLSIVYSALEIGALMFALGLARTNNLSIAFTTGAIQASVQLGVLAGNVIGAQIVAPSLEGSPAIDPSVVLMLILMLSLSWLFYPTVRPTRTIAATGPGTAFMQSDCLPPAGKGGVRPAAPNAGAAQPTDGEGASPDLEAPGSCDAQGAHAHAHDAQNAEASLNQACAHIAEQFGLSSREAEILGYLAHGRSQPYIRDALVLSKNTVATHVKHIYTKLGVHSRQELIDLVERTVS